MDYQQKRFGPGGDMVIQRRQLVQPIQDQIYAAVKEIAENKKYDFVFDKNADFLMLYSAERYDISEQVLKIITRANKREQAKTKQERRELEKEEAVPEVNDSKDERAKALEERKAQRKAELRAKAAERRKHSHGKHHWNFSWSSSADSTPKETVSDDERLMILRMLEEKKISLEEAENLLSALVGSSS